MSPNGISTIVSLREDLLKILNENKELKPLDNDLRELHFAKPNDITIGKMKCEALFDEGVWLKPKTYTLKGRTSEKVGC